MACPEISNNKLAAFSRSSSLSLWTLLKETKPSSHFFFLCLSLPLSVVIMNSDPITRPEQNYPGSKRYAMSGKIMLSAIIVLFFVVFLMVFLHLYSRWYLLRARRRHFLRRRNRRSTMVFFAADPSTATTVVASCGLDSSVINSLPVFTFSGKTDPMECSVCLSDFEENETGRVLPNCKHTFHVDCIDMWFHSHSTCPLCRSLVETEEFRRKPAAIEITRRNITEIEDDLTRRDSPASQSFRSPMSRMLSFTRMLSRERRSPSSPITGASPLSPSLSCYSVTESDIERGLEETR